MRVGIRSRKHVEQNLQLIITVNSKKVMREKLLKKAFKSLVKIRQTDLSFLEEGNLLDSVSWKSCGKKRERREFSYFFCLKKTLLRNGKRTALMESIRKLKCLE